MANQLDLKIWKTFPAKNGGFWANASLYMGKNKQTGEYNKSLSFKLYFPSDCPDLKKSVNVIFFGIGHEQWSNQETGEVHETPQLYVQGWHYLNDEDLPF
jgi:hypothetical protein